MPVIDFLKNHNVWLASVSRALLAVIAAFGFELTSEQMSVMIIFIEVVFGVGQAKANIAEPRVDAITERRAIDLASSPGQLRDAVERREERAQEKADDRAEAKSR